MADTEEGAPAAEQAAEGEEGQQAAAGAPPAKDPASDFRRAFNYPLVKVRTCKEIRQHTSHNLQFARAILVPS